MTDPTPRQDPPPAAVDSQHADSETAGSEVAVWLNSGIDITEVSAALTEFHGMLTEYTRIGEKAFNAARLVDAADRPIYDDFADWYENGDWHGDAEEEPAEEPREGIGIGQHIPPDQWPIPYDPAVAAALDPLANLRAVGEWMKRQGQAFNAVYGPDAYQRGMQLASGRDVPPEPVPALPSRVDDLDSDTYDRLRARYAWLEQRHRDTVGSEQGAELARQAKEIGELRASIAYKIRAELVCCDAYDSGDPDADGVHQICYWGEAAARIAEGRSDDTPETK